MLDELDFIRLMAMQNPVEFFSVLAFLCITSFAFVGVIECTRWLRRRDRSRRWWFVASLGAFAAVLAAPGIAIAFLVLYALVRAR